MGNNGLAGVRMDFDVEDSLVTSAGQITGAITPVITVAAVSASDEVGEITDFTGNVVASSSSSFLIEGPYGVPRTIDVNSSTTFTGAASSLGGLQPGFDADVTGKVQSNGSCLASQVSSDNGQ